LIDCFIYLFIHLLHEVSQCRNRWSLKSRPELTNAGLQT